jgi:hypothetical protein
MLTVNFDPALVRLLREVKYFLLLSLQVRRRLRGCCCCCDAIDGALMHVVAEGYMVCVSA